MKTRKDRLRFEAKFIKGEKDDCWEWLGNKLPLGYGVFWDEGKTRGAHRVSYALYKTFIPEGLFVLHRCDNPCCVNPDHLFLGTPQDNINDMIAKGRACWQQ